MKVHVVTPAITNGHPSPPRLFPLIALYRQGDGHFSDDVTAPTQPSPVIAPPHVMTGALRRGWMFGCVERLVDHESELVRERAELAKEVLAMRPESISYDDWSMRLATELRTNTPLEELREKARQWALEAQH